MRLLLIILGVILLVAAVAGGIAVHSLLWLLLILAPGCFRHWGFDRPNHGIRAAGESRPTARCSPTGGRPVPSDSLSYGSRQTIVPRSAFGSSSA